MPSKKKLALASVALVAAAPMIVLGGGAAFATEDAEPVALTVVMPDVEDAFAAIDADAEEAPAEDELTEDLPVAVEPVVETEPADEANNEEEAPEAPLPAGESDEEEATEEGGEETPAALNAPEFNAELLGDPSRVVVSGVSVPGTSWDSIKSCYFDATWANGSMGTNEIVDAGTYTFKIDAGTNEVSIFMFCTTQDGNDTPRSETITLRLDSGNTGGENGNGNTGGENGNGNTGGNENSGNGGNTNTGTNTNDGTDVATVGTSAPNANATKDELALTGGSNSLVLGLSAAGVAALGAGLILARRFTKSA
ncbi:hypothetical protein [Leucobacter massiliensis]|uniref:hypothetical protein n=1 Tax=Leucobacter massiliensis TaxID=1686285 RepID=UPI0011B21E36|nr:hypothetical protein [Leucobacter massiliensis]